MANKVKSVIKDGLIGVGIGCAIIIPGISGGTIALITGAFKKIVNAVDQLFTKYFVKNLLILLPFGIGAVLAVAGLLKPIDLAIEHCFLALTILFAAFMVGSVPSLYDSSIKGKKLNYTNIIGIIVGFLVVIGFGVLSIVVNLNKEVGTMVHNNPWYLYPIIFGVGLISSMGLIVPGFSGSMLLMVLGFYDKVIGFVLDIPHNPGWSILRLGVFALGVAIGFVFFSKLMKYMFEKHEETTYCVVLGFLLGSIIAIFVNSNMFQYFGLLPDREGNIINHINNLDYILSPIFGVIGLAISLAIYFYMRKHPQEQDA